jgi:hypothetical protein
MGRFENRPKLKVKQEKLEGVGKDIYFNKPKAKINDLDPDCIRRQTYYITEQQRIAISLMSAHEDIDKSEILRNALSMYIPKNYLKMALYK